MVAYHEPNSISSIEDFVDGFLRHFQVHATLRIQEEAFIKCHQDIEDRLTLPLSRILLLKTFLLRTLRKVIPFSPWKMILKITSTLKMRNRKLLFLNFIVIPFTTPKKRMKSISPCCQVLFMMTYPLKLFGRIIIIFP